MNDLSRETDVSIKEVSKKDSSYERKNLKEESKIFNFYSIFESKKDFSKIVTQADFAQFEADKEEELFSTNTYGLDIDNQIKYIKILYYVQNIAKNYTYKDIQKPENKEAFDNIKMLRDMNNALGISDTIKFKESRETQSINTMADVYHHTDAIVQDKNAGFQDYINNSSSTQNKEVSTYKNDKLTPQDFCKLYPKRDERQQDRQKTNPERFDPYTKQFDLSKVDPDSRPNVEEKYRQALNHGKEFLKNLDQRTQKLQKDYVMSFVLKQFSSLFMTIVNYDGLHLGYDFKVDNSKAVCTPNGSFRIEGKLGDRKMGMNYNLTTGEFFVDDFLYQKFDQGNFSIDPGKPRQQQLSGLLKFDDTYKRRPPIDLTSIIKKETDPKIIQIKTQEYTQKTLAHEYQPIKNTNLQKDAIALVEKNKIVQDRLHLFVPGAVEDMVSFGGVNNADEQAFRNMLHIWHNTINNKDPNQLAQIGKSMNQLADFCKQLESSSIVRQSFQDGATDQAIKDKMFALSKELNNIDSTQRGKAFANLIGNSSGGLLVQDGKLNAQDISTLVDMCEKHQNIDNTDGFSQHFKDTFYDTSIDALA